MGIPARRLLHRQITAREMVELRGAFIQEPRSGSRTDHGFARLEAAFHNSNRSKKSTPLVDPNDLVPDYWDPARWEFETELDDLGDGEMSPDTLAEILRAKFGGGSQT